MSVPMVLVPAKPTREMVVAYKRALSRLTADERLRLCMATSEDQHEFKCRLRWAAMIGVMPSNWLPIEGAPRDGGAILLYSADPTPLVEIGYWTSADPTEPDSCETWCESGRNPTHWQPLPAAPVQP